MTSKNLTPLIIVMLFWGCKQNPIDAPKDPREYTWTIEILSYSSGWSAMNDMYAVNSKDIWIVGESSIDPHRLFHYDGTGWTSMYAGFAPGYPRAITGFGKDNIWVAGFRWPGNDRTGFIAHYSGGVWSDKKDDNMNMLASIWGSGPSDIWFGGYDGALVHFDGISFNMDTVPRKISVDPRYNWVFAAGASISSENGYMVLSGQEPNYFTRSHTFRREEARWVPFDSVLGLIPSLWYSPWGKLYRTGHDIGYLDGSSWRSLKLYYYIRAVCGTAEDNLIAVGPGNARNNGVYHWDGTDWYQFENLPLPDFKATDAWTDGKEVFIAGNGDAGICILHGK